MKVVKVRGYMCPECGSLQDEKPEERQAWRLDDEEPVDGYVFEAPTPTTVYVYVECDHIKEAEPQETAVFRCGECDEQYEERAEAQACCKD